MDRTCGEQTLYARTLESSATFGPRQGREVVFGRNRPLVHLALGVDDLRISREHGLLRFDDGRWWVHNGGRTAIRLPSGTELRPGDPPVPLAAGYTLLTVLGSPGREHALEVRVSGPEPGGTSALPPDAHTYEPPVWPLDPDERRVVVLLARRYLQGDSRPMPQSWRQVGEGMQALAPEAGWTHRRAEHTVRAVRERLSAAGVAGLLAEEVEPPVGNALNENLVAELVRSRSITAADLDALDRETP